MKHYGGHPFLLAAAMVLAARGISLAQEAELGSADSLGVRDSAFSIIAHHYVDSVSIDSSLPLPEIVSRLDPFSHYLTSAQHARFTQELHNQEFRYGVDMHSTEGHVIFTTVLRGGSADEAGILPGDEIVAISNRLLEGNDSIALYRFLNLDSLDLLLFRATSDRTWRVVLHRALFNDRSVPVAAMINSEIGYVSIAGFRQGVAQWSERAIAYLSDRGMRSLVIDLRGNPGGYVMETVQALNLFVHCDSLPWKGVILNRDLLYHGDPVYASLPLAVLVDNQTCSAAELFAGTLQDLDRAIIIGQPTIGKCLVMQEYPLPNGDWLYLAMSRYILPSGRSIQRPYHNGILIGGEDRDFGSMDNSRHEFDTNLAEVECPQYETKDGRSVTGLAGIIPDYFVSQGGFYPEWLRNSVEGAATAYLRTNVSWLLNATLDSFERDCDVPDTLVESVLNTIRSQDTTAHKLLSAQLAWMVPKLIKAYISYDIWDMYGFFMLWERNSATVRRAVELLSKPPVLAALGKE